MVVVMLESVGSVGLGCSGSGGVGPPRGFCGARGYRRVWVEWQEGIPFRAGAACAADFHGETDDEERCHANREEDGECQSGHGENLKNAREENQALEHEIFPGERSDFVDGGGAADRRVRPLEEHITDNQG